MFGRQFIALGFCLLLSSLFASSQQMPSPAVPASPPSATIRLGAGDLIDLSVYGIPELTTKSRIGSDGNVYLPLIEYVHLADLTTEEAQALIERRLDDGGFVKHPHVSIFVDQYASQGASVLGQIARPGIYPILGQQRLFDLISAAGGLTDKAGRGITITRRADPDHPITVPLARNITDHPESNIPILPGDTVVVRKADIIYVVGDVTHPSGFLMDTGHMTALQAIAMAGGPTKTAKLNSARIIRKTDQGMTETTVELKKMLNAKTQDVQLEADDILFVPSSTGKMLAQRSVDVATSAASTAAILAVP